MKRQQAGLLGPRSARPEAVTGWKDLFWSALPALIVTSPLLWLGLQLRVDAADSVVEQTLARLKPEEGFRAKPYLDSQDILTIGFGTNIGEGITRREAEFLLRERLEATYETLFKELPWLSAAPEGQQSAILDLGYQIGVHGLLGFHGMLSALEAGDCPTAKAAALDSEWARETPKRAERVTAILCED